MPRLADRITRSSPKNYGMYAKAAGMADQENLIHLALGRPGHDTPEHIKEAAISALRAGHVHYSDLPGILPLRAALAEKLRNINHIEASPDDVIVTNGLTHASFAAFQAVVDPGDEVILLSPFYPQHVGKIELAGGKAVPVALDDRLEAAITQRTKAIVLVNPSNPTGHVHARHELEALAAVAIRHDLLILADEVYETNVYEGRHLSIASLPGMAERTITMFAFTKGYAMDGWRIGYATAAPDLIGAMLKVTANDVTHVNTFVQYGALAAITSPPEILQTMLTDDRLKRDLMVSALNRMRGVKCSLPAGATYAFPDIRGTGLSSQVVAERLLVEEGVVVEPGAFYGEAGEGFLRISYSSESTERLQEAVRRMHRFFEKCAADRGAFDAR